MKNLLTETTLANIAKNTCKKIAKKYKEYEMISSGIIMTVVIFQLIKTMINLKIRGCASQALYG